MFHFASPLYCYTKTRVLLYARGPWSGSVGWSIYNIRKDADNSVRHASAVLALKCSTLMLSNRFSGAEIASEGLKGRVFEFSLGDLNNDEDLVSRVPLVCRTTGSVRGVRLGIMFSSGVTAPRYYLSSQMENCGSNYDSLASRCMALKK